MKDRKIAFGIVGMGHIGRRHLSMIDANAEAVAVAAVDIRTPQACEVQRPDLPFYLSISEMLISHPEIDIVSVCTPNGLHAQMAIEILRADKYVLMEKPLALSSAEVAQIAEVEKHSRGKLISVFQNRYTPALSWVKQIVSDKTIGDITSVEMHCLWNRDNRYYGNGSWHGTASLDGGTLFTQYSHFLDLLLWWLGPIDIVAAQFADHAHADTTDFEDSGTVLFKTSSGALGTMLYSTAVPQHNFECSALLVGTRGTVRLAGEYMSDVVYCDIENYAMPQLAPANPPNDYGPYKGSAANHCYVIANAIDAILRRAMPTADIADGARVVQTIEDIYRLRRVDYTSRTPLKYVPR